MWSAALYRRFCFCLKTKAAIKRRTPNLVAHSAENG
jgi:hypothetical protein